MDWDTLIAERNAWVATNFPDQEPGTDSVFGVLEEVGELAHAHLKQKQGIRMNEDHEAKAKDAIGDIIVYLLGVMSHWHVVPQDDYWPTLFSERDLSTEGAHNCLLLLGYRAGWLCRRSVDPDTLRVRTRDVNGIVFYCRQYSRHRGWDFEQIVTETWNEVKRRNWIENPDDADVKARADTDPGYIGDDRKPDTGPDHAG